MGDEHSKKAGKKMNITLSGDVLDWIEGRRADREPAAFVEQIIRERMRSAKEPCDVCDGLRRLETRMEGLEKALSGHARLKAAGRGRPQAVTKATTRPADVFGELVHIKNVSAANARAVLAELVPFLREKKVIYRDLVLRELFPRTRSTITNEINYWYNACRGVLDGLIERGYVVKLEKGKYRWVGDDKPLAG